MDWIYGVAIDRHFERLRFLARAEVNKHNWFLSFLTTAQPTSALTLALESQFDVLHHCLTKYHAGLRYKLCRGFTLAFWHASTNAERLQWGDWVLSSYFKLNPALRFAAEIETKSSSFIPSLNIGVVARLSPNLTARAKVRLSPRAIV